MTSFPWEVNPLTIVAVFKGSDDILYIGADSQWTDTTGLRHYKNKLQFLEDKGSHIAWGTAGNPQIGITEFRDWVTARTWADSESWQHFIEDAATEFARLNAIRKKIGEEAGENITSSEFVGTTLCQMLICGRIGGHVGAYFLGHNGNFQDIDKPGGVATIGTGAPFAEAVYYTQKYFGARLELSEEELFSTMMHLTSVHAPHCNLPYEYMKITSEEVWTFRSPEPEPGAEEATTAD